MMPIPMPGGRGPIVRMFATACLVASWIAASPAAAQHVDAWGALGAMEGSCWSGGGDLSCYEWEAPGEVLRQSTFAPTGEQTVIYRLGPDGTGVQGDDGSRVRAPRANVTVRDIASASEPLRVVYALHGAILDISVERYAGGAWLQASAQRRTLATAAQVSQAQAATRAFNEDQRKAWGVLADLAGRRFVQPGKAGYLFSWTEAGAALQFTALQEDGQGDTVREIGREPGSNGFVAKSTVRFNNGKWYATGDLEPAFALADGGFYFSNPGVRIGLDEAGNLTLQRGKAKAAIARFEPDGPLIVAGPASREAYALVEERSHLAAERAYQAALAAERALAAEEARSNDDGGLFGALVGAAVGAYAGSAAGLDTAQTMDLMMQGAAASGNSGIAQGFARGLAEETAKQQAMQQSMEEARYRGLVQGAAEYERRQATASASAPVPDYEAGESNSAETTVDMGSTDGTGAIPPPSAEVRACRVVTKSYEKKSIPLASRDAAEAHVRSGMAGACPLGSTPSLGSIACSENSEPVWGRDERGVPRVTGKRSMFTCSAQLDCSPVEVCDATTSSGGSAQ